MKRRKVLALTRKFLKVWEELACDLPSVYDCQMSCAEADAIADLYRAFGEDGMADSIISRHAESEDEPEECSHQD